MRQLVDDTSHTPVRSVQIEKVSTISDRSIVGERQNYLAAR